MDSQGMDISKSNGGSEQLPISKSETTFGEPILYDADAKQRIPFLIEYEGEQVEVAFILDSQTDAALLNFDKLLDRRVFQADQQETGERNAVEQTDKSFDANVWLFKDRALAAEGFGGDGDKLPEDWKETEEVVTEEEKGAVIENGYLAAQVMPLPIAKPGKRLPLKRNKTAPSVIQLKALFEGHELILTHEMRQATADQIGRFRSIQKERWIVQGTRLGRGETRIPPKLHKLGQLYKELNERTSGYKNRVPLHHQMLVVMDHLSKEVEAVRKN